MRKISFKILISVWFIQLVAGIIEHQGKSKSVVNALQTADSSSETILDVEDNLQHKISIGDVGTDGSRLAVDKLPSGWLN